MERLVSVATGALGPVLDKLATLLKSDEHNRVRQLAARHRRTIEFIKLNLQDMHSLLLRMWDREDLDAVCKEWMVDARELSYDMEDDIDDYFIKDQSYDRSGRRLKNLLRNLKIRVEEVSSRFLEQWIIAPDEATSNRCNKRSVDPRAGFLHKDASELVGMEKPKEDIVKLLRDHAMVCIHGSAGMGKTTLADLVYQSIGDGFQCRAFVTVSKSPDMLEVLGAILRQVTDGVQPTGRSTEAATVQNLIDDIANFLSGKRYLVIVDDIWYWKAWETIRKALPKGDPTCRIITTSRVNDSTAAQKYLTEEGAFIYRHSGIDDLDAAKLSRRILQCPSSPGRYIDLELALLTREISADLSYRMPLAVRCFTKAAAYPRKSTWRELRARLWHALLNTTPEVEPLFQSLRLGYDDLPVHAKTCLLYCSIYPIHYEIEKSGLVRKWVAEGFVYDEEAAEACLDELVYRDLLQPAAEDRRHHYSVHPVMRAFLICKSIEANFVAWNEDYGSSSYSARPRRVSVVGSGDIISAMDVSRTRSLVVFSYLWPHTSWCLVPWEQLKHVRVLSIEEHSGGVPLHDTDQVDMCSKLLRLRYLGLKETPINVLPPEIGRLQNLEALDVSYTEVSGLPKEVMELWRLKTLDLSNTQVGELPREIGGLQELKTLDLSNTQVGELPREIGQLRSLKTMDISNTQVGELPREIGGLQELKTLDLSNTQVRELPREIGGLQNLKTLDISNTNVRELPACLFSRLSFVLVTDKSVKLSDGDLDILRAWKTDIFSSSLVALREDLSIMLCDDFYQLLPVAALKVVRRHMRIPKWVRECLANVSSLDIRLCKLEDEDLKFLQGMPNLKILTLRLEVPPKEPIVITGGGFSGLVSFTVDCHRLPPVTFKEEPKKPAVPNRNIGDTSKEKAAMPNHEHPEPSKQEVMPNLEHLEFKFYAGRALGKGPVGITQLKSLTRVAFRSSKWYSSDAPGNRVVIDQVRKEAKDHPKGITISVNGKEDGIVFLETKDMGSGRSGSSKMEARLVDKAIIEKKDGLLREAVEQAKL